MYIHTHARTYYRVFVPETPQTHHTSHIEHCKTRRLCRALRLERSPVGYPMLSPTPPISNVLNDILCCIGLLSARSAESVGDTTANSTGLSWPPLPQDSGEPVTGYVEGGLDAWREPVSAPRTKWVADRRLRLNRCRKY